jgi:hypothetical protein
MAPSGSSLSLMSMRSSAGGADASIAWAAAAMPPRPIELSDQSRHGFAGDVVGEERGEPRFARFGGSSAR